MSLVEYLIEHELYSAPARCRHRQISDYFPSMKRLSGTPLELWPRALNDGHGRSDHIQPLPKAPIVRGVLIRQQYRRSIHAAALSQLFRQSLVAVDWFRYERWVALEVEDELAFHQGKDSRATG